LEVAVIGVEGGYYGVDPLHLSVRVSFIEVCLDPDATQGGYDVRVIVYYHIRHDGDAHALHAALVVEEGLVEALGDVGLEAVLPYLIPANAHTRPDVEGVAVVLEASKKLAYSGAEPSGHVDDGVVAIEEDVHGSDTCGHYKATCEREQGLGDHVTSAHFLPFGCAQGERGLMRRVTNIITPLPPLPLSVAGTAC